MFADKIWGKLTGKVKFAQFLTVSSVVICILILTTGGAALGQEELDVAKAFIEWNSTDGDYGIQFFWDSEGFTEMSVTNEEDGELFVETDGNIFDQGLTEVAIESVEPTNVPRDEFFTRFPAGLYTFEGRSTNGEEIEGEADLTHDLLVPVVFTKVKLPFIKWIQPRRNAVTGEYLDVLSTEVVVELIVIVEEDGEEEERVFKEVTNYPAGVNFHLVGYQFMRLIKNPPGEIEELKVEILVKEPSENATITEQEAELFWPRRRH